MQTTVASSENLPITPISFFPDWSAKIAILRIVEEDLGGLANVSPIVSTAVTPSAMSELIFGQFHLYQNRDPATICSPPPQDNVNGCRRLQGARPFTINLAEQMTGGNPFKDDPVDSQHFPNEVADTLGKSLPIAFPKWQKEVEGKHLRAEDMFDVIVQSY